MKWVLLTLVFLLCSGCGVAYVLDLWARRRQIGEMLAVVRYLRREIRCSSAPLNRLLVRSKLSLPLLRNMDLSDPFDLITSYEKSKTSVKSEMFFREEDWTALDELFYALGRGDGEEQESRLSLCEQYFCSAEDAVREQIGKNGKSAVVLGCSAGAVLVLMLL